MEGPGQERGSSSPRGKKSVYTIVCSFKGKVETFPFFFKGGNLKC